jgi:hypothetical protein
MVQKKDEQVFKLVFNKAGDFLYAEGPDGNEADSLTFEEMSCKKYDTRFGGASFQDLLLIGGKEPTIRFVDVPGHSICGGTCGGVPFSFPWCR